MRVKDPSAEILRLNNVPYSSGIFFFQRLRGSEEYRVIPVSRNSFYSSIYNIAQNLVHIMKHYRGRPNFQSEIVKQITTKAELRKDCLDMESCILAFFDGRPTEENIQKFNTEIEKLERVKLSSKRYDYYRFNWVNATCHSYLAEKFDIDNKNLPGLTFYYRYRNTYSSFVGLWESITLGEFFERCVNDRCLTKDIAKDDVTFKNIICEQLQGDNHELHDDELETKEEAKTEEKKEKSEYVVSNEAKNEKGEEKVDL